MRSAVRTLAAVAAVLVLACGAYGATYYVATGGSDSANGSSGTPWATLQHAVNTISSGDTVIVRSGTFAGCRITSSGASGSPKTLRAETVGAVTLNNKSASATHNGILEIEGANYWVLDGFHVDGVSHTYRCIDVREADYITISNNTAHDAYATGIFFAFADNALVEGNESYSNNEHGVYSSNSADYGTFRQNWAHDNVGCGIQFNADASMGGDGIMSYHLVEKNTSYSNSGGAGLNCDGLCDSKLLNNLLYNNLGSGIALFAIDATSGSSRNLVYNNTVSMPSGGRWALTIPAGGSPNATGNKVKNNILYNAGSSNGSITTYSSSVSGFESDYNVVIDRFSVNDDSSTISLSTWRGYGYDTHSVISTPSALFVDPASNDYHLKAGSPAVNAGTTLADVTTDKDGVSRPQSTAYDIGCYEGTGVVALNITTASLSNGQVGAAYSATVYATGGTTPYTWAVISGSLPSGLSLASSTGVISGTPSTAQTSNFTIRVTDNVAATDTQALSITINPAGGLLPHPRIWINSAILASMQAARAANSTEWLTLQSWCDARLGQNIVAGYNFLDWYGM